MGRPPAPRSPGANVAPDTDDGAALRVLWAPRELPDLGPDVAGDLPRYRRWAAEREVERLSGRPDDRILGHLRVDLLMVVDDPDPRPLSATLATLAAQTTDRWHLAVAAAGPSAEEAGAALGQALALLPENRASVVRLPAGTGQAAATAVLFGSTTSPVVILLHQHDRLAPDAIELLASALSGDAPGTGADVAGADVAGAGVAGADVAYADDDRLGDGGEVVEPRLKPDWSPELFLSWQYLGRPLALRRRSVAEAGGIRPLTGGDWEHDLLLRVTEGTTRVAHVAEVLCHRGDGTSRNGAEDDGAVVAALGRRGEDAMVLPGPVRDTWRVLRRTSGRPQVTAVVPFRDTPALLRTCVDSVRATTGDVDLHLVLVDNGSEEPETLTLLDRYDGLASVTIRHDQRPFNWASLNNAAVLEDGGEVLVFLNNDIEARQAGWLSALCAQALRPSVGAVGARLSYPSGRLQHAGVVLGMTGAAGHVLCGLDEHLPGYLGMAVLTRDCSAVTGACLATRRDVFCELAGFDESLGLDLNDIDYCLRARQIGLQVIYEPQAALVHHESVTRGLSGSLDDQARFLERWQSLVLAGDHYLSPHLTRLGSTAGLRQPDEEGRWQKWRADLQTS